MNQNLPAWGLLRNLVWEDVLIVLAIFVVARLLTACIQWALRRLAEYVPSRLRLTILRFSPLTRPAVGIAALAVAIPLVIEPTLQNVVTVVGSVGLVLAFAMKDYGSSYVAGLVSVFENTYQPGDWIEVNGTYGEVRAIGIRAVHIVTPDDTEVIIPSSLLWSTMIFNASSGNRSLMCVANFYLHPEHDAFAVRKELESVASASTFRKEDTAVVVIVQENPWGTHYKLKAYVKESREQFLFITDLTMRGKKALQELKIVFAQAPVAVTVAK